ncbi:yidC [Acrasis kona]|uniref:YidC n=1 Tax=Acrasis kona TaxID=1008807 RepID=A0AAW2ZNW8_9EUKA
MNSPNFINTVSISASLIAAGFNYCFCFFDIPILKAQKASRSLPSIRWLFSRGSHVLPTLAAVATSGFAYLAYLSAPQGKGPLQLLNFADNGIKFNGYLLSSLLNFAIVPFTMLVMLSNNFKLIKMNEEKGGTRSADSARHRGSKREKVSAYESISGKGALNQFTDLSGPQEKTIEDTTEAEDKEVNQSLDLFQKHNLVRAVLSTAGGMVGIWTALSV